MMDFTWRLRIFYYEITHDTPILLALGFLFPIVKCFGKCDKRVYWDPIIGAWCDDCQKNILYKNVTTK